MGTVKVPVIWLPAAAVGSVGVATALPIVKEFGHGWLEPRFFSSSIHDAMALSKPPLASAVGWGFFMFAEKVTKACLASGETLSDWNCGFSPGGALSNMALNRASQAISLATAALYVFSPASTSALRRSSLA